MYNLIGVDGNAFAIMGYTSKALKEANLGDKVEEMQADAMSGDYAHLLEVCQTYINMANMVTMLGLDLSGEEDEE